MCLDTLQDFKPCKRGYVVVRKPFGKKTYQPFFCANEQQRGYRLGCWHKAKPPASLFGSRYYLGFHVWHAITSAREWRRGYDEQWVVVEVECDGPVATGYQHNGRFAGRVTVCRKRKIIREVE